MKHLVSALRTNLPWLPALGVAVAVMAGGVTPAKAQNRLGAAPPTLGPAQGPSANRGLGSGPGIGPGPVGSGRPAFGPPSQRPQRSALPPQNAVADSPSPDISDEESRSGWRFPKLNPFRRRDPERPMASLSDSPAEGPRWKLPSIPKPSLPSLPSLSRKDAPQAEREFKPLQRLNAGARGFFSTARNTISKPFQRAGSDSKRSNDTPRWRLFNRQPDPPQQPVESANDWLKLPRPSAGGN